MVKVRINKWVLVVLLAATFAAGVASGVKRHNDAAMEGEGVLDSKVGGDKSGQAAGGCECRNGQWCEGPKGGVYCLRDDGKKKYRGG